MKNLSPEKRKQLALISIVTVGVLAGLWFGLIRAQKNGLERAAAAKEAAAKKLEMVQKSLRDAEALEAQVSATGETLGRIEETMASGDLYSWAIYLIRQFKAPYKVEIPQFSQIDGPKDVMLLPGFPYKQASITIGGTAQYNELGRFIADFENTYPYFRVLNLSVEPSTTTAPGARETLSFRMDIVALIKPAVS